MSEAPQPAGPDLHAIFGIEGDGGDPVISVERADAEPVVLPEEPLDDADSADFEPFPSAGANAPGRRAIELDTNEESDHEEGAGPGGRVEDAPPEPEAGWTGITQPSKRGSSSRFLTDVIVDLGLATRRQVDDAVETSRSSGIAPERILIDQGAINNDGLARALAERYGLDHLDLGVFQVDMSAANLVSTNVAKRYQAVPVSFADKRTLLVAMADPSNVLAVDDIAIMTGHEVRVAVAPPDDIAALISRLDRLEDVVGSSAELAEEEDGAEVVALHESSEDAPVIKLVNQIVGQAVERGASDIHFAPDGREVRVRFRIDGVLQDITTVPRRLAAGAVSRVKIMAELDIAEKRLPQDGRIGLVVDGRHVDLRVVTLPSVHGEGIVMRVLDKTNVVVDLDKLGMSDGAREQFEKSCHETHGAVLVTGPTGSGKSTTLYAALQLLNTPEKNIITVEDPVEYEMSGLTQLQVSVKTGMTFATGLRSIVRADPDVIMVGEIRDRETAQIAVESALTGHLVLSTLHTNDAPSAITRLTEMGVEPFLVASSLECIVAQRLTRQLCSSCKRRTIIPAKVLQESGYKAHMELEAYEPVGCRRCGGSGYKGRLGLYEVMTMSPEVQTMTLERRPAEEIRDVAVSQGMVRLRDDGLQKVRMGRTSMAEIARVIGSS
ncbi:MAG: type pilus assembly protein PilB [Solirubrobacteraceae bacterium]|jgi:type IV pilus assembly protein PilB|nr:type secretion system protein GspE [Solirubrobacterales bacterium]MEA2215556.1 type pilus assembly protein PilB [Solirubrobacteraceae bacterium]